LPSDIQGQKLGAIESAFVPVDGTSTPSCKKIALNTGIKLVPLKCPCSRKQIYDPKSKQELSLQPLLMPGDIHSLPVHPVWLTDASGPPQDSHVIYVKALGFSGCHEFSALSTVHTRQASLDLATVISAACSHREKCLFYRV